MEQVVQVEPDVPSSSFEEKRRLHRRRVLKSGTITLSKGFSRFSCRVRNLTDFGVMLEMGETTGIPQEIDFEMDGGASMLARVVWRTQDRMGLSFEPSAA